MDHRAEGVHAGLQGPHGEANGGCRGDLGECSVQGSRSLAVDLVALAAFRRYRDAHGRFTEQARRRAEEASGLAPEEKLRAVVEASGLAEGELGKYLRKKGLHTAELEEWRAIAVQALRSAKKVRRTKSPEAKRIRVLEKEVHRKDKALAEVTALLALKKKLEAIWGDEDDRTRMTSET
ncbi:MAG: hypothetical protein ACE5F1_07430 [Planctomycetota bacterium]